LADASRGCQGERPVRRRDLAPSSAALYLEGAGHSLWKFMRLAFAFVPVLTVLVAPTQAADLNDYPTSTRADYVFACMKANGETRQALEQCSCSIDVIATILPYDRYVAAETVASVTQQAGQIGNMFRNTAVARDALDELRRAQAEAQVRCF
jgi:hypothetical protein